MAFFKGLLDKATSILNKVGVTEAVQSIKESLVSRAVDHIGKPSTDKTGLDRLMDDRAANDYKQFISPLSYAETVINPIIFSHDQYTPTDANLKSNYLTYFVGLGFNSETGEEGIQPFSIAHDELLTEEDVENAIAEMAGNYDIDTIEEYFPMEGLTILEESLEL
jgi:hypothetical protein